jgi:hypothetical protein
MTAILMGSGISIDLDAPSGLSLREIAFTLARICRFGGHLPEDGPIALYSVADHSVLVSRLLGQWGFDRETQMLGLLHDAHEALIGDITTPVKHWLGNACAERDAQIELATLTMLGAPVRDEPRLRAVKLADQVALMVEAKLLGLSLPAFGPELNERLDLAPDADQLLAWDLLQPDSHVASGALIRQSADRFLNHDLTLRGLS